MTFSVGQKVVYPTHGVCLVEEIASKEFGSGQQEMYVLRVLANSSKVMVPKENLELVGLRPLCSQEAIRSLFGILEDGNIDTYKDWKGRYKQNLDKMKTGRLTEVAEVLKNLSLVSQKKSLSFREKKMYERAKYFIVSEVAHVQDIAEAASLERIEGLLETSLSKLKARKEKAIEKAEKAVEKVEKPVEVKAKPKEAKPAAAKAAPAKPAPAKRIAPKTAARNGSRPALVEELAAVAREAEEVEAQAV